MAMYSGDQLDDTPVWAARMEAAGLDKNDASEFVTQVADAYSDADPRTIDTIIENAAVLLESGADWYTVDALREDLELHLVGDLFDAGYSPLQVAQAADVLQLERVLAAHRVGITPSTLITLHNSPHSGNPLDDAMELASKGMPPALLENTSPRILMHLEQAGLTWDDITWLESRGVLADDTYWYGLPDLDDMHVEDPAVRRLLTLLTLVTSAPMEELRPVAIAVADQPWADTLVTLLTDASDTDVNLTATIVTARALGDDRASSRAVTASWHAVPLALPERRTIDQAGSLTPDEAAALARLKRDGQDALHDSVKFWLEAGMRLDDALETARWAGAHTYVWSAPVETQTGANPLPQSTRAAQWLTGALARGNTLGDVRTLASAFHQRGLVGPFAAARVLGLGVSLQAALDWAQQGYDVDTAAILTAYGIEPDVVDRVARAHHPQASRIAALGVTSAMFEDALTIVTHWPSPADASNYPEPVSLTLVEALIANQLTTSHLDDHGILEDLAGDGLDEATLRTAVELHARFGQYAEPSLFAEADLALAAAISGKPYERQIVTGTRRPKDGYATSSATLRAWERLAERVRKAKAASIETPQRTVRVKAAGRGQGRTRS